MKRLNSGKLMFSPVFSDAHKIKAQFFVPEGKYMVNGSFPSSADLQFPQNFGPTGPPWVSFPLGLLVIMGSINCKILCVIVLKFIFPLLNMPDRVNRAIYFKA